MLPAMGSRTRSGVALLAIGAAAAAQTFVVDASNGPGANFTDLPAAVAAVPDGAVLDVRPGSYSPFAIASKGLSVIFQPGALVQGPVLTLVSVTGTSAQQTVLLRGLQVATYFGSGQVQFTNCQGLLLLEDFNHAVGSNPTLAATNCIQLHAVRCHFGDSQGFGSYNQLDHSSVVMCNSSFVGRSGPGSGLFTIACQLQLIDTSVAVSGFPSGPAISMQGGDLRMVGGSTYSFLSGFGISGTGTARIDPSVALFGGPPSISPSLQATFPTMPAVTATGGALGTSVTVDLRGPAGDFGALLAGLPGPPLSFPGIADPSWMLPGTEVVCASTILAAGTRLSIFVPVPNLASLRGTRIVWQGASFSAANGLQASNPAVTTHW